jgi:hypothetical protein
VIKTNRTRDIVQENPVKNIRNCLCFLILSLCITNIAQAQATRTWVSGVGDDANPCSRTAPCKTFAGAISKTSAGGEIDALDPGGFGALTITKAITIDGGGGQVASVLVSGTNGIVVNAGASDVVSLRNLSIDGLGSGINGISFVNGGALHIEHCAIFGFTGNGIDISSISGGRVTVSETVSKENGGSGIFAVSNGANVAVTINASRFENNVIGVFAVQGTQVSVTGSVASGNTLYGFSADANGGPATLNISNSIAANNNVGIEAGGGGASAVIHINGVSVSGNQTGLATGTNGSIVSFGNNFNSDSGLPSSTIAPR